MKEKLAEALEYISDEKIAEAAEAKKRHHKVWLRTLAAVLAAVLIMNIPYIPLSVNAKEVALASGPRKPERPDRDDYGVWEDFRADLDIYDAAIAKQRADARSAFDALKPFFTESGAAYVDGSTENRVWSPVNAYIALAMLAEVTDGDSRQQVLNVLNTPDLDTLRTQVGAVWEEVYCNPDEEYHEVCILANSLWLNQDLNYVQETMDALAYYHYASVYQTDLASDKASKSLQTWLDNNTGGLLSDKIANAGFPRDAVLTLASTVYLQAKWTEEFSPTKNTSAPFHSPNGDITATFMNKDLMQTYYYWGDSFGAVSLWLKNDCKMWFILPDEDKTVDDVLREGQYLDLLTPFGEAEPENSKYMKVNLSVPKFDVSSSSDLSGILQDMGVTDVFDISKSDFTAITSDAPVYLTGVNQAARVIIDEQGVKAASYIEMPGAGAAMPPEEIIDFILDRPFIFVIAEFRTGMPLFTGVVNNP